MGKAGSETRPSCSSKQIPQSLQDPPPHPRNLASFTTFPSPGDLPNPGIEPGSSTSQAYSLPSEGKRIMDSLEKDPDAGKD